MRCICIDISSGISNLFKKENIFSSTIHFSRKKRQIKMTCIFTFKIHEKFNFFEENIFSCLGF